MAKIKLPKLPLDKIAALSRLHRILICVGVLLLLGGGFFYLIYMPKSSQIEELKNNYEGLENKLRKAKAAARNLKKFEKELKEAEVKFKLVLRLLPDKKEIPSLLENISKSGKDSGLEFILFRPGNEVSQGFYAEIPVNINVKGGYHNLATFIDKVTRMSRIVNILNIKVTGAKAARGAVSQGDLNVTCVAKTYRFLGPDEQKPEESK